MDESGKYYAEWKKSDSKGWILYDSTYMTLQKGKNKKLTAELIIFCRPGSMNSNFMDEETDSEKIKHFAKISLQEKKQATTITVFSHLRYVAWQ